MRYFLFASILFLAIGCAPRPYRDLDPKAYDKGYLLHAADYRLKFDRVLYNCTVNGRTPLGKRFSLSGLLFFKQFADGSERVVFQNQMGVTYFDLGWDPSAKFTVHQVMPQMDKPALIRTLKKDIEMLLFRNLSPVATGTFTDGSGEDHLRFDLTGKGFVHYIFNKERNIIRIENADEKRKVTLIELSGAKGPDTLAEQIRIRHLRANFSITLHKLEQEENTSDHDLTEQ